MRRLFVVHAIILGAVILCRHWASAEVVKSPMAIFEEATESYDAGKYISAGGLFESMTESGYKSGNLFYNIGNCYIKNNELSKAILNYERAKVLMPADNDLAINYRYARSLMKQEEAFSNRPVPLKILDKLFSKMTYTAMIYLVFVMYFGLAFYVIAAKIFKKVTFLSNLVVILWVLALVLVSLPLKYRLWDIETGAIVIARITDARFEPTEGAMPHFPLYEGMKVNITRQYGPWYRIIRPDGRIGWVNRKDISSITPF